uniref:Uncharacterized protein n=1 Tax=Strigamia maritima TaxID=126957 RepID=T1JAL7_STRMM
MNSGQRVETLFGDSLAVSRVNNYILNRNLGVLVEFFFLCDREAIDYSKAHANQPETGIWDLVGEWVQLFGREKANGLHQFELRSLELDGRIFTLKEENKKCVKKMFAMQCYSSGFRPTFITVGTLFAFAENAKDSRKKSLSVGKNIGFFLTPKEDPETANLQRAEFLGDKSTVSYLLNRLTRKIPLNHQNPTISKIPSPMFREIPTCKIPLNLVDSQITTNITSDQITNPVGSRGIPLSRLKSDAPCFKCLLSILDNQHKLIVEALFHTNYTAPPSILQFRAVLGVSGYFYICTLNFTPQRSKNTCMKITSAISRWQKKRCFGNSEVYMENITIGDVPFSPTVDLIVLRINLKCKQWGPDATLVFNSLPLQELQGWEREEWFLADGQF